MKYYSTTRRTPEVSLREAVVASMAPDNGLYMPDRIERLPDAFFDGIARLDLHRIACRVADAFFGEEIEPETLRRIGRKPDVFVHMERFDPAEYGIFGFDQPFQEFILRMRRCEYGPGCGLAGEDGFQSLQVVRRGCHSHLSAGFVDRDV